MGHVLVLMSAVLSPPSPPAMISVEAAGPDDCPDTRPMDSPNSPDSAPRRPCTLGRPERQIRRGKGLGRRSSLA